MLMLSVVGLKVRSLDVDFMEVSWRIRDTMEDIFDYSFQLQRSESVGGPWDDLSIPFFDKYLFYDKFSKPFNKNRTLNYRLVITNIHNGDQSIEGPVNQTADVDLFAQELRRQVGLLYREFVGRRCWLLPIRTFGQRCTCWSNTLQKRTRSGCSQCYDTGFVRGYLAPIEMWAQVEPVTRQAEQVTSVGLLQQQDTIANTIDMWAVKPRDILIEAENQRWRVASINQTELGRAPTKITMQLHAIPQSDIEYKFPLELENSLRDMWLSPARNFTNPHNLESFEDEEIPRIFSLYPTSYPEPDK